MSVSNCCISQGSVSTYLRCGGNYYTRFVGNFFLFTVVQEILKSVKIWQSYRQSSGPQFFGTQCISCDIGRAAWNKPDDDDDDDDVQVEAMLLNLQHLAVRVSPAWLLCNCSCELADIVSYMFNCSLFLVMFLVTGSMPLSPRSLMFLTLQKFLTSVPYLSLLTFAEKIMVRNLLLSLPFNPAHTLLVSLPLNLPVELLVP